MDKKVKLEISEESIPFILQALEGFIRAKLFQFDTWIEQTFPEHYKILDWDKRERIMKFLRSELLGEDSEYSRSTSLSRGIYHPDCIKEGATAMYELLQVLRQYQSVQRNNGFWGTHTGFYDPLTEEIGKSTGKSKIDLPKVLGFDKFIDVPIRGSHVQPVRGFLLNNKYKEFWEYFDKNIGKKYNCDKYEVVKKRRKYFIRYHKPRKKENSL